MTEDQIREIEEKIYMDLSPVQKAASELEKKLPVEARTLNDEAWRYFHFDTSDFHTVNRTIVLACEKHGWVKNDQRYDIPMFLVPMEELIKKVMPSTSKGSMDKTALLDYDTIVENLQQEMYTTYENKPVFVYTSIMEIRSSNSLSESDHSLSKMSSNLPAFQIMDAFARACAINRLSQRIRKETDLLSNRLFFVSYGSTCIIPDRLRDALYTISYDSLEKKDYECLLWEFHLRKERAKVKRLLDTVQVSVPISDLKLDDELLEWYKNRMSGLEEIQVRRLLASMDGAFASGQADYSDRDTIEKVIVSYKNNILKQHGRLVLKEVSRDDADSIVSLDTLQTWLNDHASAINDFKASASGILLVGIPGTGKSQTAKKVAGQFGLPLVQLDMSRILGGRVGDSEKGMQEMLDDLRFVAPCVLWIDEIEKTMSGASSDGGDGGVVRRLFGMLLTFIQENKKPVFTVTTANEIKNLPPEFFRNGRMDATFCLMMPDYKGCAEIMKQKLNNYGKMLGWNQDFSLDTAKVVLNECIGTPDKPRFLTGADIDSHVKELYWRCRKEGLEGNYPEDGCNPKDGCIIKYMQEIASYVRVQALPSAPYTMEDIAERYLFMIRKGLTMADAQDDTYSQRHLNVDAVRFYSFDQSQKGIPLCLDEPERFIPYRDVTMLDKNSLKLPNEWYDARFFYELTRAMSKILFYENETPGEARSEYYKLMKHLEEQKRDRASVR